MFTGVGEILSAIWAMPWYKVMVIAAADDIIVMLKIWPLYLIILLIGLAIVFIAKR